MHADTGDRAGRGEMFYRLRRGLATQFHTLLCRGILDTLPLRPKPADLIFCSMTSHRDLIPYLVAAKSIYRQVGEGRFVVINDGSLTPGDMDLIRGHLIAVDIRHIRDVPVERTPRGGTWERLLAVLDLSTDGYVIQFDSDTLTLAAVPELMACFRDNIAFTLAGERTSRLGSLQDAADNARDWNDFHVQGAIERRMDRFENATRRRYVRGCSGFAGFPRGSNSRLQAEAFSVEAEHLVGQRWSEWGSEQVTSNYVIANQPNAVVLPYDRYANFEGDENVGRVAFLHFIGQHRFKGHFYARSSRRVIAELQRT